VDGTLASLTTSWGAMRRHCRWKQEKGFTPEQGMSSELETRRYGSQRTLAEYEGIQQLNTLSMDVLSFIVEFVVFCRSR
jgi:hypothetical protein